MPARTKQTPLSETSESAAPKRASRAKSPAATHAQETKPRAAAARKAPARKRAAAAFDPAQFHEEIAREAYLLWLGRGMAHGFDQEDWYRAVEIVRARHAAAR